MRCVGCVQRRVVQGSGEGSGGCVVHVDVHGGVSNVGGRCLQCIQKSQKKFSG